MKRYRIGLYLLVILQLALLTTPLFASDWVRRSALSFGERVRLMINENHKIYYEAITGQDVVVEVTGPATMHVITRVEIPGRKAQGDYEYQWRLDNTDWTSVSHYAKASENASLYGATGISLSRQDVVEIPEGTHSYTFRRPTTEKRRLFFRITSRLRDPLYNVDITPLQPTTFGEVWQIIVRETNFDYYVARGGESIVLDVVGPTTIKVISRLDYDSMMMGEMSYRIKVFEDEVLKNTYSVQAKPSSVAYYEN
ncbi:hypothetical protein H8D51_00945, partial [bacterium]|nr:hypothetical protein [bacterium]